MRARKEAPLEQVRKQLANAESDFQDVLERQRQINQEIQRLTSERDSLQAKARNLQGLMRRLKDALRRIPATSAR